MQPHDNTDKLPPEAVPTKNPHKEPEHQLHATLTAASLKYLQFFATFMPRCKVEFDVHSTHNLELHATCDKME